MIELLQVMLGLCIGWRTLLVINVMTPRTHHGVRALHVALATCGAWMALTPLFSGASGDMPKLCALAAYLAIELVDRRRAKHAAVSSFHPE